MNDTMTQSGARPHSTAVLSLCGTYRYELTRRWSRGPSVGWVMLNPSTADADTDDPTIRRCIAFAKAWGYGGITVRNLFALRATDPSELGRHADPVGPHNDTYLHRCRHDHLTVVAWGARGGDRGRDVLNLLAEHGVHPYRLGATGDGQPRHPLYLKADLVPTAVPRRDTRADAHTSEPPAPASPSDEVIRRGDAGARPTPPSRTETSR